MLNANVGVSYEGPAPNAQIGKNGPKVAQNDRQVLRIGPRESYGCSEAFGMGLAHSMIFLPPACLARRLVNIQGWKSPPRAGTSKASGKV